MISTKGLGDATPYAPPPINIRCPACQHVGAFGGIGLNDLAWVKTERQSNGQNRGVSLWVGIRKCPNIECQSVLFYEQNDTKRTTYPAEVINFDATNLPPPILASLEEAIKCHAAGCYRAAALMVRRVLEEMCQDKQAKGSDLKKRIAALSGTVVLPSELLEAADELRLLGNDAAHIEAKDYDSITTGEVEVALELTKELLKAVYQYTSLVARLRALKKPSVP